MKKIWIYLFFLLCSFYLFDINISNAIFWQQNKIIYCQWEECSLDEWIKAIKESDLDLKWTNWNWEDVSASEYYQDLIIKLMQYISLIAVIFVLFAWFRILTSGWDEETVKKQKKLIFAVAVWLMVMWLAWTIVRFVLNFIWT